VIIDLLSKWGIIRDNKTRRMNVHVRTFILNDLLWEYYQGESNNMNVVNDVTNEMLIIVWTSSEHYYLDFIILSYWRVNILFKKMLTQKYDIQS